MNESTSETPPAQAVNDPPNTPPPVATPTPTAKSRGQLLYENHCTKCHESQVHIRAKRKSRSISDVQAWVSKWQTHEKLEWGNSEISDVTRYLIDRFYQFK